MDPKLITGTVDMLILHVLSQQPAYGYAITQEVLQRSGGQFALKEGSLYPSLHRMERSGFLESYWTEADSGRRRKYYRITAAGRRELAKKQAAWREFSTGVDTVLGGTRHGVA